MTFNFQIGLKFGNSQLSFTYCSPPILPGWLTRQKRRLPFPPALGTWSSISCAFGATKANMRPPYKEPPHTSTGHSRSHTSRRQSLLHQASPTGTEVGALYGPEATPHGLPSLFSLVCLLISARQAVTYRFCSLCWLSKRCLLAPEPLLARLCFGHRLQIAS